MSRIANRILFASVVATSLLLSACVGDPPPPEPTEPMAMPEPEPPAPPAPKAETATEAKPAEVAVSIVSIDLGKDVDDDGKVTAVLDTFGPRDTIHASISTDGTSAETTRLSVKWTYEGMLLRNDSKNLILVSPNTTDFSVSKPTGWLPGKYKAEISLNGTLVESKDFTVVAEAAKTE